MTHRLAFLLAAVVLGFTTATALAADESKGSGDSLIAAAQDAEGLKDLSEKDIRKELKARLADQLHKTRAVNAAKFPELAEIIKTDQIKPDSQLTQITTDQLVTALRNKERSIYGRDCRQEIYSVTNRTAKAQADSVVALMSRKSLARDSAGNYQVTRDIPSFGESQMLCPSEAFVHQPVPGFCTGFLVAPDVVATAGHCIDSDEHKPANVYFVFGFRMRDPRNPKLTFTRSEVYRGKEVLAQSMSEGGRPDFCLVKLDRPVTDRSPLPVRQSGTISAQTPLYVIGHPCGLPAKFASDATVLDSSSNTTFTANLDTFGGNSGSPVFNGSNGEVEGILVSGQPDFLLVYRDKKVCRCATVMPQNGKTGETITRISTVLGTINKNNRR